MGVRRGVRISDSESTKAVLLKVSEPEIVEVALTRVKEIIEQRAHRSTSPKKARPLRPHQEAVLAAWRAQRNSGIVVFATGGGKTLTGLAAANEWLEAGRPVLIGVPSTLLLEQWLREIRVELPDVPVLMAGGGNPRRAWEENLRLYTQDDEQLGPRIVLTTYDTAVTPDFIDRLVSGPHLMVLADEVHRVGAPDRRAFLTLESGACMGLSATPERYGDPEGTEAIFGYFGQRLSPEFGIQEAIAARQLVPYDYDFVTTTLTDEEREIWDDLSGKMAQEIARNEGKVTDRFLRLARERSRTLKSAARKAGEARRVLDLRQKPGDRWLVYCESRAHLREVRDAVETPGRRVLEYHSGNSHLSKEIFQCFEEGGVLLAIRCLDEGVDLPFVNKALILASTTNPREYIQRRGRVLRTDDDKYSAEIVDMLVVDDDGIPLVVSEARRALEFAKNAANRAGQVRLEILLAKAARDSGWKRDDLPLETEGE